MAVYTLAVKGGFVGVSLSILKEIQMKVIIKAVATSGRGKAPKAKQSPGSTKAKSLKEKPKMIRWNPKRKPSASKNKKEPIDLKSGFTLMPQSDGGYELMLKLDDKILDSLDDYDDEVETLDISAKTKEADIVKYLKGLKAEVEYSFTENAMTLSRRAEEDADDEDEDNDFDRGKYEGKLIAKMKKSQQYKDAVNASKNAAKLAKEIMAAVKG